MKIKEFQACLRKKGISSAILFNKGIHNIEPNFYYFAGSTHPYCIVIPAKSRPVLIASKMDAEAARKSSERMKVIVSSKNFFDSLKKYAKGKKIGIDKSAITILGFSRIKKNLKRRKFIDISQECLELRSVKTGKEIAIMKKGFMISDNILKKCFKNFRRFKTEQDVEKFLKAETLTNGCELSFDPIVASGRSSSQPHHVPGSKKISKGFCVIDFGVRYKGYCTDTTRTIYVGKPSEKETRAYKTLLDCQKKVISSLKPGIKCSRLWDICSKSLGKLSKNMIHALGHGVGLEIHELPNLRQTSKDTLKEGMTLTVEPGIYFTGKFGIRIEDTVFIGKKPVLLTKIPKDLLRIR